MPPPTTIHHHTSPSTTTQHQPKYIHHQPKYIHHHPPPPTTSQNISTTIHHHPLTTKIQSFTYENHCKSYRKLVSRSRPVLFTLTYFFSYTEKVVAIIVFLRKLDHRLLSNHICYEAALVWGLVSTGLTIATHCLLCKTCYFKSVKFQLLLFSTELKEVCSNYVTATGFEPTAT